jgi:alpha-amylase/alpha-mannosidase (GH57 family)
LSRYVCIHGHFYQPPRENAWLETVEAQDSAYPYHDWNERITAECYAPNAHARILDANERIVRIVNNYARISYNVGPTLMAWLERMAPETYRAILEGDARSRDAFGGHGAAMAQAYSHPILPLCNPRDKRTQVLWGVRDFELRFGRSPVGMWLPETAVDLETLEVLAAAGIRYTVLSPAQAAAVRAPDQPDWQDVGDGSVDPRRAYRVTLRDGAVMNVFFYDGAISQAVAFEHLLGRGDQFARRLLRAFDPHREEPQLVHVATDGESYGHHHAHGDMALAYALQSIEERDDVQLTHYAAFLAAHPPRWEARIAERTAWSCAHGLGRWSEDCGCGSEIRQGWGQHWRAPLRATLDWLRDQSNLRYERVAAGVLADPWRARDRYVDVILDRSPATLERFFAEQASHPLSSEERSQALELLELQRHLLLMYTSCGWFFEESSRIETLQVLQYAVRAAELSPSRERCCSDSRGCRATSRTTATDAACTSRRSGRRGSIRPSSAPTTLPACCSTPRTPTGPAATTSPTATGASSRRAGRGWSWDTSRSRRGPRCGART